MLREERLEQNCVRAVSMCRGQKMPKHKLQKYTACVRVQEHLRQKRNHDEAKVMKDGRKGNRAQVGPDNFYNVDSVESLSYVRWHGRKGNRAQVESDKWCPRSEHGPT